MSHVYVAGATGQVAIEVKGARVRGEDLKGMLAYTEEHRPAASIIVCAEPTARRVGAIDVLPWEVFLERLWTGAVI